EEGAVGGFRGAAPIPRFAGTSPALRGNEVGGGVEVEGVGELFVAEFVQGLPEGLGAVGGFGLLFDAGVDRPALFGDLGEVAHAATGDQDGGAGLLQGGVDVRVEVDAHLLAQQAAEVGEHP